MIRGELLHAKRSHAAGEYEREVSALGKTRARDVQAQARVRNHEDRFWREIARASKASRKTGVGPGGECVAALHRALAAHHALSHAKGAQRCLSNEVQTQVARVVRAKYVLSAFERMSTKERLRRAHTLAERGAEEIDQVASLRRVMATPTRTQPGRRVEPGPDIENAAVMTYAPALFQQPLAPEVAPLREAPPRIDVNAATPLTRSYVDVAPGVVVTGVDTEVKDEGMALRVRAESSGTPISCHLAPTASGGVGIVVETAQPSLVGALERERRDLARKLSDMGIAISRFEVRPESTTQGGLFQLPRRARRPREDDDDTVIA